jgi:hypothetical protein
MSQISFIYSKHHSLPAWIFLPLQVRFPLNFKITPLTNKFTPFQEDVWSQESLQIDFCRSESFPAYPEQWNRVVQSSHWRVCWGRGPASFVSLKFSVDLIIFAFSDCLHPLSRGRTMQVSWILTIYTSVPKNYFITNYSKWNKCRITTGIMLILIF